MALDPEARSTSNSAMTMGIIALVLVVGAIAAFLAFGSRNNDTTRDVVAVPGESNTTVVNNPAPVAPAAPVPGSPSTVVVVPKSGGSSTSSSTTTSTTTSKESGASGTTSGTGGSSTTDTSTTTTKTGSSP